MSTLEVNMSTKNFFESSILIDGMTTLGEYIQKLRDQKAALKPNETELAAIIDQQDPIVLVIATNFHHS